MCRNANSSNFDPICPIHGTHTVSQYKLIRAETAKFKEKKKNRDTDKDNSNSNGKGKHSYQNRNQRSDRNKSRFPPEQNNEISTNKYN